MTIKPAFNYMTPTAIANYQAPYKKYAAIPGVIVNGYSSEKSLYTIPQNNNGDYIWQLNKDGLKLFKDAQQKFSTGEIKGTLYKWRVLDGLVPFCAYGGLENGFPGTDGILTFLEKNSHVYACHSDSTKAAIQTSIVVLYTNQWCLTLSGSVYALVDKLQ